MMTRLLTVLALLCLSTAALADDAKAAAPKAAKKGGKEAVMMAAADVKWMAPPDAPPGLMMAVLWGDPMKSAHGVFAKFPAGMMHPAHMHTPDTKVVVISGTFTYGADEASSKEYGPGSYVMVPGKSVHVSGCKAGADCVIFQESAAKFDMKPVGGKPEAKKEEKKEEKK